MQSKNGFLRTFLALFAVLLFLQLNWAKQREFYEDIFLRVTLSFVLTFALLYLLLQSAHPFISRILRKRNAVRATADLFLPCFVFYVEGFQFVRERIWPAFLPVVLSGFAVVLVLNTLRVLRREANAPDSSGKDALPARSIGMVNQFFATGMTDAFTRVRHALTHETRWMSLRFYPMTWVILSMQLVLIVKFSGFGLRRPYLLPAYLAGTLILPVLLVDTYRTLIRPRIAVCLVSVPVFSLYFILTLFQVTENTPFDFSLLRLNSDLLGYGSSLSVLINRLRPQSFVFAAAYVTTAVALLVPWTSGTLKSGAPGRTTRFVLTGGLYLALLVAPYSGLDQIKNLYTSVRHFASMQRRIESAATNLRDPFPYHRTAQPVSRDTVVRPMPNIFFVCLESCNGMLIEQTTEDGKEITPFLNRLIDRGVYVEHFYGNSVQTARGFFSILTGIPPSFREKEFTTMPDLNLRALPQILNRLGFETVFVKDFHDLSFDNTGPYMKKLGYSHVLSMTRDRLTEEDMKKRWGWGLQDDIYYRKCFEYLDEVRARQRERSEPDKPFFLTTFNVSHHLTFNQVPSGQKYLYPDAGHDDFVKNFRNSMFVADSCLREFFIQLEKREWLANSIVFVMGDHGFPSGVHSIRNEKGAWEEVFRTPLLVIWNGKLPPRRIGPDACSQVDILPTVLDLLGVEADHHAVGSSIFAPGPRDPVLLAQPYDGLYLVSTLYPYKYVKQQTWNAEFLFNLEEDPLERRNLIGRKQLRGILSQLRSGVDRLVLNQALIEENRIWPEPGDH